MATFGKYLRHITVLLAFIILLAGGSLVQADDQSPDQPLEIAKILHPPLDRPVAPLDTLILIEIDEYYIGDTFFYLILLDDRAVNAMWDPDARAFSYYPDRMLDDGEHTIKVYMTEVGVVETQPVAYGTFRVGGGVEEAPAGQDSLFNLGRTPVSPPPAPVIGSSRSDFFSLSGRISIDSSFVDLNGLGSSMRQEPDNTSIFSLNGRGREESTDYNFRFYITSDETDFQQPRNRYIFNVEQDNYTLTLGDTTPRLNELMLNGLRLRGASGSGNLGDFSLYLATGESRRETSTRYREDGRIQSSGVGQRRLVAGRLAFWEDNPISFGVSYLSGKEEESDVEGRGTPGDNEVRSADVMWRFDGDNGLIKMIWAESDFDFEDAEDTDLNNENACLVQAEYNIGGHNLKAKWQKVDPGFMTLGRISLQKDRETWGIEDRINISRGQLTGRLYIEKFINNLNDQLDFTTTSRRYGGQLRYRFALRGPTVTLGINFQDRSNDGVEGESGWLNDGMESYTAGVAHTFDWLEANHNLRIDWRSSDRNSLSSLSSNSTQDSIMVSMTSSWPEGFQVYLLYSDTDSEYPEADRYTDVNRYSARLSFRPRSNEFSAWTRYEAVRSSGNQSTYDSNRDTMEFGLDWRITSDMSLEASMKFMDFDDMADNAYDFDETTVRIMLVQLLN